MPKKDSPYKDISTLVISHIDERIPWHFWDNLDTPIDWDGLYSYWVKYIRYMKRHHILDKDGELVV